MNLFKPMEPILRTEVISGENYIHQIKWDGIRGITYIKRENLKVFTKKGRERTEYYPELRELFKLIRAKEIVLDGEIIVLNEQGKPTFEQILTRERVTSTKNLNSYLRKYPIKYIVFDILSLNGQELTKVPYKERKQMLLDNLEQNQTIGITDDFLNGEKLIQLMREKGWEGIVSKEINSLYFPGKHHNLWFKTKLNKKILAVIGGIQWKDGFPNSLLLGIYQNNRLIYIGKASTGLKRKDFILLKENIDMLASNHNYFTNQQVRSKIEEITFTQPLLTCWVEFLEWTNEGILRHPIILGFSSSKPEEADGKEIIV